MTTIQARTDSPRRTPSPPRWRAGVVAFVVFLIGALALPWDAFAGPRSGGSFSGRGGFRSGGGSSMRVPSRSYRSYPSGGGTNVVVVPGGGYGYGYSPGYGYGYGGGGFGLGGTVLMLGVLGVGGLLLFRAARMAQMRRQEAGGPARFLGGPDDDGEDERDYRPDRAYVYKVQLGLGRSARALQARLEQFAAEGDTASESGLAQLLQQTALELLREKESIRYGAVEAAGPLSLTNAETKMNGLALAERSRFQVERVRGAEGKVRRAQAAATTSSEVLEYLLVTLIIATRTAHPALTKLADRDDLDKVLREIGGVAADALLGLEVVWTPADPEDALTEANLLVTYPDLRGI
jgi:uncharacterized membrane protein